MDYDDLLYNRLVQLRTQKGVSARDMSLSLGQSESYINKIENRKTFPSMTGFFYICEYLGIHPSELFNENIENPEKIKELISELDKLDKEQLEHILAIIKDLNSFK
ncbi:MAG: helix-turn-helix domain-containing protein [Sedimentibacter sp.]